MDVLGSSMHGTLAGEVSCEAVVQESGKWVRGKEREDKPAIRLQVDIWRFLQLAHVHHLSFVGETELFEDDGDFPWVGA